VENKPY